MSRHGRAAPETRALAERLSDYCSSRGAGTLLQAGLMRSCDFQAVRMSTLTAGGCNVHVGGGCREQAVHCRHLDHAGDADQIEYDEVAGAPVEACRNDLFSLWTPSAESKHNISSTTVLRGRFQAPCKGC